MNWNQRIESRELNVGIMGLGYVGLPLALEYARDGFPVTGFDIDHRKVQEIESGRSPLSDVSDREVQDVLENHTLDVTTDMGKLSNMDAVSICVPTPLRKSRDPDISFIAEATETILRNFEPPGMIILESTTYPGTTEEILAERFIQKGWDLQNELFLAFSPERIDPGNREYGIQNTPKVVGGYNSRAGDLVSKLYGQIIDRVVQVSSTRSAEMVKLLENTFRSVNIGLANEMALLCDRMDINVWEVINAAATKPFGFMPFYPGPGLGGHCIPVDPLFLSWKARLHNTSSRFIELADEINRSMPDFVFRKVVEGLNDLEKSVRGSRVCVFGVAYKANVGDTRESPAYDVISQLLEFGAEVTYCDPYVPEFSVDGEQIPRVSITSVPTRDHDAALILTEHDEFHWSELLENTSLVIDTRNAIDSDFSLENLSLVRL